MDIEVGSSISQSPIRTDDMLHELMIASTALGTTGSLEALTRARHVLIGIWILNICSIIPLLVYTILKDTKGNLIALGMVVIPLYISKMIESLNKTTDKITKVVSESDTIRMRIMEIFDECKEQRTRFIDGQILQSVAIYITSLSRGILSDLAMYEKDTDSWSLIFDSFMWKIPRHTKYLDRTFVNEKAKIIFSMLKMKVK